MSINIKTNIASLQANRELNKQTKEINKQFEHLSSGNRISRASDDPAGLAVAVALLGDAGLSALASRNISDGVSLISIADSALESTGQITDRMAELAAQSANGTLSDSQRSALNNEYQQLSQELDRIAETTEFNDLQLLSESNTVTLQAGTDGSGSSQMMLSLPSVSAKNLGLPEDISTQANARSALDAIDGASNIISQARGSIGAVSSRFEAAIQNLGSAEISQREAAGRIKDLDVAEASSNLIASQIREQAATAMSAQANQAPSLALQLLG